MSDQPELGGKVSLDTTDFKTAIATVNREIRVIESGFRASAAALGDWSKDASGLEMRMQALTQEIGLQQGKVAALRGEYDRVAAEKGENSRAAQELQIKLNKETETLGKMQSELGQTQEALDSMGGEAQATGKQVDKLADAEEETISVSERLRSVMGGLGGALKAGVTAVAGLAAAAAGAAVALGGMVVKAADMAGELVDTSIKTGLSVEKLQELDYVAGQLGTDVDTVTGSMARMVRGVGDAIQGTGTAKDAFKSLGIELKDSNGELKTSEQIFNETISALGEVGNETERDALAMEIFGRSAQELNPLIKAGADEIAALTQQAHDVGAVMGEDSVFALESFGDQLASLKASFQGVVGQLAAAVLPAFQQLVTWVQQNLPIIVQWLQQNLPIAIQTLSDFWTNTLLPAIQTVWNWMQTSLIPLLQQVFAWLAENLPPAIQALSAFWTGTLLPAIQTVWKWIAGTLLPFLGELAGVLITTVGGAISGLAAFWTNTLQPAITAVWGFIDQNLLPLFKALADLLSAVLGVALTALAGLWENVLLPAIQAVWDFVSAYLQPVFDALAAFFKDTLGPNLTAVKDSVLEPMIQVFKDIKDAVQWVIDKIVAFAEKVRNIDLPDWLTPGSPTPFEIGLRGIAAAMQDLNEMDLLGFKVPAARQSGSFAAAQAAAAPISITIQATVSRDMDMSILARRVAETISRNRS